MKFTQEIKDNWLAALRSEDSIQCAFTSFREVKLEEEHSVLKVLQKEIQKTSSNFSNISLYLFLVLNGLPKEEIIEANNCFKKNYPRDYSNVIPLIEELKVVE